MSAPTLREIMTNWPPTAKAGLPDAPLLEFTDVIKQASVVTIGSSEEFFVLHLSRGKENFVATENIPDGYVNAVKRAAPQLIGRTIKTAGEMVIDTDQ